MENAVQAEEKFSQFPGKYLCLETYRTNGQPLRTPVWFLKDNHVLYLITGSKTGKVKRIRKNPYVKVAPCDFRGKPEGEWVRGRASLVDEPEAVGARKMLDRKYGLQAKIGRFYQWIIRRKELVVSITETEWPVLRQ